MSRHVWGKPDPMGRYWCSRCEMKMQGYSPGRKGKCLPTLEDAREAERLAARKLLDLVLTTPPHLCVWAPYDEARALTDSFDGKVWPGGAT